MADGYWNQQRHYQPPVLSTPHNGPPKRHRSDTEGPPSMMPSGYDMHGYVSRDEDRDIPHSVKDTRTIGSAYDRYLQSVQMPSMPSEEAGPFNGVGMGRPGDNNMIHGPPMGELIAGRGGLLPIDIGPKGRAMNVSQLDSAGTPSRKPGFSTSRYIFRPFVGYREVRLVTKDSKHGSYERSGDPIVLCFVDFENPACAATALSALQGYQMDEDEPDSKILRLQFSRNLGPRPGQRGGRR